MMRRLRQVTLVGWLLSAPLLVLAAQAPEVGVSDTGFTTHAGTWECAPGHLIQNREIDLVCGSVRYGFGYTGCMDPSHGDQHPAAEGNFGMPVPTNCNWYWGGFLNILINGQDAVRYTVSDMRALDTGSRGSLQVVWQHPDAEVGLRMLLLPGENHVLSFLTWRPRPGKQVTSVTVKLTCYPSFFTTSRHRQGERHCLTPRTDEREPRTLTLVPTADTWLCYYDKVFDRAKGEGEGPCAALVAPGSVQGGRVLISDYAVQTELNLKPEAGEARLGFYDFVGKTNAQAEGYLRKSGVRDLAELTALDFRPLAVRNLQPEALRADADRLLAEAGDDGLALKPQVEGLLAKTETLQQSAAQGDWRAEADLADLVRGSADVFWRLRIFAALNKQ
jgi:hypothetical protein